MKITFLDFERWGMNFQMLVIWFYFILLSICFLLKDSNLLFSVIIIKYKAMYSIHIYIHFVTCEFDVYIFFVYKKCLLFSRLQADGDLFISLFQK